MTLDERLEILCKQGWDFRVRWEPALGRMVWWGVLRQFPGLNDPTLRLAVGVDSLEEAVEGAERGYPFPVKKAAPRLVVAVTPKELEPAL